MMNTSHPVRIICPDSPALQAVFIFEDARFILELMVQVRGMLVWGRTSRLPGYNEVGYIPGGVAPPTPAKQKRP